MLALATAFLAAFALSQAPVAPPPTPPTPPATPPAADPAPVQPAPSPAPTAPPDATPAPSEAKPAATTPPKPSAVDQIIKDLESKSAPPPVHASTPAGTTPAAATPGSSAPRPEVRDMPMTGEQRAIASGKLLREGSFVVSRRARMVRVRDAAGWALVFDNTASPSAAPATAAPSASSTLAVSPASPVPDVPMLLQPCQKLAEMERLAIQFGDALTFTVSGQVFVFKGRNYLLPSVALADRADSNLGR